MTPAEFKTLREALGLSTRWLAERWDVQEQTIQRWERTRTPPDRLAHDLQALTREAGRQVEAGIDREDAEIMVPRTDSETTRYPAMWYRRIASRIAAETGATIVYRQ